MNESDRKLVSACPDCGSVDIQTGNGLDGKVWCGCCGLVLCEADVAEPLEKDEPTFDWPKERAKLLADWIKEKNQLVAQCNKWHSEVGNRGAKIATLRDAITGLAYRITELTEECTAREATMEVLVTQIENAGK